MTSPLWQDFRAKAARSPRRIVLADGEDRRAIEAAAVAQKERIADPLLVGSRSVITSIWKEFSSKDVPCIDPSELSSEHQTLFLQTLSRLGKFKDLSDAERTKRLHDPLVLGSLFVKCGIADGFIGGATRTTTDTLRAVFSIIGLAPKVSTLFGFFLIEKRSAAGEAGPVVLLADCAVIPEPSPKQLANIAIGSAAAFEFFTSTTPKVIFLSFSTAGSAEHERIEQVRQAREMAKAKMPSLAIEGEWQADAALDVFTAGIKGVGASALAGQGNVLVVPDLNCGNIAYKLVQRLGGCRAVGPVLWGMAAPANDLSRGCRRDDIVDMMALTVLQAQALKPEES